MIQATNDSVLSVVLTGEENGCCDGEKREPNVKLSSKDKARIGNYAVTHGMSVEPWYGEYTIYGRTNSFTHLCTCQLLQSRVYINITKYF